MQGVSGIRPFHWRLHPYVVVQSPFFRRFSRPALFALVLLVFASLQFICGLNEVWDDSFIGMIYSRNIARGVGPVFLPLSQNEPNAFSYVEGYSNPLWTFLIAGMYLFPGSVFFWMRLASFLSAALLALSCSGLFRELIGDEHRLLPGWLQWLPALLILLNRSVFAYTKSGMETVFFTALVITALWHTLRLRSDTAAREYWLNALLWVAVALTRPEGIMFGGAALLFLGLATHGQRDRAGRVVHWLVPFAVSLLAFLLWRHAYYGEWLPNTFYAKVAINSNETSAGWVAIFAKGAAYALRYFVTDLPAAVLAFAIAGLAWARRLSGRALALFALAVLGNLFFIVFVGGDFWAQSRLLQVTSAILTTLGAVPIAMIALGKSVEPGITKPLKRRWAVVLALLLLVLQPLPWLFTLPGLYGDMPIWSAVRLRETLTARHLTPAFLLGKWMKENLPPGAVLGVDQAGQIPYYCDREVIDLLGLNDHHLARRPLSYSYLRSRGMTHLIALVLAIGPGKEEVIYPGLLHEDGFRHDFVLTHFFRGRDQHHNGQAFALFTRRDQVPSEQRDRLRIYGFPDTLDGHVRNGPTLIRLAPDIIRDLAP